MKHFKQWLAMLLVVLLMTPTPPVTAAAPTTSSVSDERGTDQEKMKKKEISEENDTKEDTFEEDEEDDTSQKDEEEDTSEEDEDDNTSEEDEEDDTSQKDEEEDTSEEDEEEDTSEEDGDDDVSEENEEENETLEEDEIKEERPQEPSEEVRFNTGDHVFSVVGKEDFEKYEFGDACFEEDGSYTINIPEENPFFPYEVQFTYDGKEKNKWFMTPDDSVEVGGHTFYISAYFDNTVVTQMSLKVGGDTIVVYPEEKEFSNDGEGISTASLLPSLTERHLSDVDLSGYTPAELTMVSLDSVFTGSNQLKNTDKVAWTCERDNYTVTASGGYLDLSCGTEYGRESWKMIVGDGDQLTDSNIRYKINVTYTESCEWLLPSVYAQDTQGNRRELTVTKSYYEDYRQDERGLDIFVSADALKEEDQLYVGLKLNSSVFSSPSYHHLKFYEGKFSSASEAAAGKEITSKLWQPNMKMANAGYIVDNGWVTMVTYDSSNRVTGCLPFYLNLWEEGNWISGRLYDCSDGNSKDVLDVTDSYETDERTEITCILQPGYAVNARYNLVLEYWKAGVESASSVTAAYVGNYASAAEAKAAGATDIKASLFGGSQSGGYAADYSQGMEFTIFVKKDSESTQERYVCFVKAEKGSTIVSGSTAVRFYGLKDGSGNNVDCYVVNEKEDSYGEYNYRTILVGDSVDLSDLAPEFNTQNGVKLYAEGGSSPEVSGKSRHDFSKGAVQYSASAENKEDSKNYWLQIVKASDASQKLYINSFADQDAKTQAKNGVVYSTREIMLDGYHDNVHDILLANMGNAAIPSLSVSLTSDVVELDDYWTLSGKNDLEVFDLTRSTDQYATNLAKIRLKAKSGAEGGSEVSGTLHIRSGGKDIAVLTLTGSVGDPQIITKTIPQAVKYVPYGTMIQNSNKYGWNEVAYYLEKGTLPKGMEIKPNGELYGVPLEEGEFTFTVCMESSRGYFSDSSKTYTLTVLENTDANVDQATDAGYDLTQRVQNITLDASFDQTMVSQGVYN